MVKRIAIYLACIAVSSSCFGALTLQKREPFQGVGTLTSGSPGLFDAVVGTFYKKPGGPYIAVTNSAGFSADCQQNASYGRFAYSGGAKSYVGAWYFVKKLVQNGSNSSVIMALEDGSGNAGMCITSQSNSIYGGVKFGTFFQLPISAQNQWIFLAMANRQISGATGDGAWYYKLVGGSLTKWYGVTNGSIGVGAPAKVLFGQQTAGTYFNGRIGCPSVYTFSAGDFSEVAYPSDLVEPTASMIWYVNPSSGSDSNDGLTPATAWQTAGKINTESQYGGIFSSATTATGDTLYIDTSSSPLNITTNPTTLDLNTSGLNVRAAPGQSYWTALGYITLTNSSFTAVSGLAKTYQTTIGSGGSQAGVVPWENDKWLNHPTGATLASVTNSLETTAGSFWTDGTTMYIHPFGDTNPTSDGKTYTCSIIHSGGTTILLDAITANLSDCYSGKTALADKSSNDPGGGYVIGTQNGWSGTISHCLLIYGSKHILGLVADSTNSTSVIQGIQAEQCQPYGASVTPFVSYMQLGTSLGNYHHYNGCQTLSVVGLIGSTNGQASSAAVFVNHNNGVGINFAQITFTNCYFPLGSLSLLGPATNVFVDTSRIGSISTYTNIMTATRCLFDLSFVGSQTSSTTNIVLNCIASPTQSLTAGAWTGTTRGYLAVTNTTIDMSFISSSDVPHRGFFARNGASTIIVQNCVFYVPTGKSYTLFSTGYTNGTDTITGQNNVFKLGDDGLVAFNFYNGGGSSDRTFSQWQGLGFDTSSSSSNPCLNSTYHPYAKTPCWTTGAELGPAIDFTGKLFQSRRTAGAYEYTANPMMIAQ